jgi:hypothetical protein
MGQFKSSYSNNMLIEFLYCRLFLENYNDSSAFLSRRALSYDLALNVQPCLTYFRLISLSCICFTYWQAKTNREFRDGLSPFPISQRISSEFWTKRQQLNVETRIDPRRLAFFPKRRLSQVLVGF